jgi:hypothetical protein
VWADTGVVWLSGGKEDYNRWSEIVGDEVWRWEEVQRRFKEVSVLLGHGFGALS